MSKILKKLLCIAATVAYSFSVEKNPIDPLVEGRLNLSLSKTKLSQEEIDTALSKIVPYISKLTTKYKIDIINFFDGQFGDTRCQLRALEGYLRITQNKLESIKCLMPAYALATHKKYLDFNMVHLPFHDSASLRESINSQRAGKKISGEQNFAAAIRSVYLQEMYAFLGCSGEKVRFVEGITATFPYPALEFFESYNFLLGKVEEHKIPVKVIHMDFVNADSKILLNKTTCFEPFGKTDSDLFIVFEMYSSRPAETEPFKLELEKKAFFKDAVLAIGAIHPQYPGQELAPELLSDKAQKFYKLALENKFGIDPLFKRQGKGQYKGIEFSIDVIPLNTFHVYLSDKKIFEERLDELNSKESVLQVMEDN